jgi:2-haloacid dehalogenase
VLLFDVFGTLVDWRSSVMRECVAFGARHGLGADWGRFADRWRREGYSEPIGRIARGDQPWEPVDRLHRRMLDHLLTEVGGTEGSATGIPEEEVAALNRVWHRLEPWPDVVDGLRRLRENHTVAPLSNGSVALLTALGKHAGMGWDCVLSAELFGAYKPNPAVYLGALRLLDVAASEAMMVAAHPGDLRAARAQGLQTAYVPRPLEFGPAAGTGEGGSDNAREFDFVANDLFSLAEQLEGRGSEPPDEVSGRRATGVVQGTPRPLPEQPLGGGKRPVGGNNRTLKS